MSIRFPIAFPQVKLSVFAVALLLCLSQGSEVAGQWLPPQRNPSQNENLPLATAANLLSNVFPDRRPEIQPGYQNDQDLWLLYAPDFDWLSGGRQSYYLRKYGLLEFGSGRLGRKINNPALDFFERNQSETSSATSGRNIVVAFNDSLLPFGIGISYSNDAGRTWKQTFPPIFPFGSVIADPVVAVGPGDVFYVSALATNSLDLSTIGVTRSSDGGATWSPLVNAAMNRTTSRDIHDKEWLAVDSSNNPHRGNIYVSWTRFTSERGVSSGIGFVRSTDGGTTWSEFKLIGRPIDAAGGVQGSMIAVGPAGEVYVAYFDSRIPGIAIVKSVDGGERFGDPVVALQDASLQTSRVLSGGFEIAPFPSIAVDTSTGANRGAVYITIQVKPANPSDASDIILIKSTDGGATWSAPLRINADTTDTDQFMPSLAVSPDGTLGIMWYDRRNDVTNNVLLDVYMTTSRDAGNSFSPNRRITSANWMLVPTPLTFRPGYHGDYNQMSAGEVGFVLNWGDDRSGTDTDIEVAILSSAEAQVQPPDFILSSTTPARYALAGSSARFTINMNAVGNFDGAVRLEGAPSPPGWRYSFSTSESKPPQEVTLELETARNSPAGTYPITITGRSGALERSTTLRLVLYNPGEARQAPTALSYVRDALYQPKAVIDNENSLHVVSGSDPRRSLSNFGSLTYSRYQGGTLVGSTVVVRAGATVTLASHAIGVDLAGNVTVVWRQFDSQTGLSNIFVSRSADQGATFSEPGNISGNMDRRNSVSQPVLAVSSGGAVNIAFVQFTADTRSQNIVVTRSTDGATFSTPVNASSTASFPTAPAIAVDQSGAVGIAFFGSYASEIDIFFTRSADATVFSDPINVANTSALSTAFVSSPSLAIDLSGQIHLAYVRQDRSINEQEIYYTRSANAGFTFSEPVNVSRTSVQGIRSFVPAVGSDGAGNIGVAWGAFVLGTVFPGGRDILFCKSADGGQTFTSAANISNSIGLQATLPSVVMDASGQLAVLWDDDTGGNNQIFVFVP